MTEFANKEAIFSCIASGANSFHWRVNEMDIDMLPHQLRDDILTEDFSHIDVSTLAIKARVAYNGTRVQCVVIGGGGSVESDTATLTIQGMADLHNFQAIDIRDL